MDNMRDNDYDYTAKERLQDDAQIAKDKAHLEADKAKANTKDWQEDADDKATHASNTVKEKAEEVGDAIKEKYHQAKDWVDEKMD
ncbi:MAG: hypothetical protein LIP01_14055 [Tannerellaceae bacterium]|nr:hypothetical protein [Tannerellaceae bacterium]